MYKIECSDNTGKVTLRPEGRKEISCRGIWKKAFKAEETRTKNQAPGQSKELTKSWRCWSQNCREGTEGKAGEQEGQLM